MAFTYKYPRPMVTVDMPIFRLGEAGVEVLLIRRDRPPFAGKWAMCGGFIEMDETLLESARRELREETGLTNVPLVALGSAGDPGRDPRGRTISIVYAGILEPPFPTAHAGDDAREVHWFSIEELPPMAFDHLPLLHSILEELRFRTLERGYGVAFMPREFTRKQWKDFLNRWLGSSRSSLWLLKLATALRWVEEEASGNFRKRVETETIFRTSFSHILQAREQVELLTPREGQ